MPHYTIICNWKMYFSHNQATDWTQQHTKELHAITQQTSNTITLCPSFDALQAIHHIIKNSPIMLGGQDCAPIEKGPLTGQIPATSLKEIGCTYCIIGHSETRLYQGVSDKEVAEKLAMLLPHSITPIICIGETRGSYEQQQTDTVLRAQLKPIFNVLQKTTIDHPIYIAYEPVWAIGTGVTPDNEYLEKTYTFLEGLIQKHEINQNIKFLYGGSVNAESIKQLKAVSQIEGFLIGSASINFQELKNIVLLL